MYDTTSSEYSKVFLILLISTQATNCPADALTEKFPYTRISTDLPQNILNDLPRIINYRFGTLPDSNMLTTEVRSHVAPGKTYRFQPGSLTRVSDITVTNVIHPKVEKPSSTVLKGKWTQIIAKSQPEANVLGKSGSLFIDELNITIPEDQPTAEKLAYYNAILLNTNDSIKIESPFPVPVNVVHFEKNYELGYLRLPSHGGGYYLEKHNTPHLWSPLDRQASGYIFLGKEVAPDSYEITAFNIPYGQAVYAPGGVIHCDGLLIGEIMAIYTITEEYDTGIIISPDGITPKLKIYQFDQQRAKSDTASGSMIKSQ